MRPYLSYLWARGFPTKAEENFEQWVSNRFGRKLYDIFFKTYTEKVWGIPCTEIAAEWAAQRIQNLSLGSAVRRALFPQRANTTIHTLVDRFEYPRLGPGQLWDRCRDLVCAHGQQVLTGYTVVEIHHAGGRVTGVLVRDREGRHELLPAAQVISSLALADVIRALRPAPPTEVLVAAEQLRYRGFLTVGLVVDRAEMFGDNWLYVHSPEVRVGRIQNHKNWSPDLVQDPEKTCLGLEYFVWEGNDLWASPDEQLIELAIREAAQLGLLAPQEVSDGLVVRMEKAYPVYDDQYKQALATIREYLQGLSNLQQIGRNGQHRYNNQDHSMMTAILAVRNVMGERHDIWAVNIDAKYHETFDRAQPRRLVPAVRSAAQRSAPARRAH
jgi:protoporphyrinogen oxidase